MPNVRVITNDTEPAGKVLGEMLAGADEFLAASAFLNSGGLELVYSDMERILANEGSVQLVHGADFRIADPDAIDRLVELKERHLDRFYYYVVCDWHQTTSHHFHPKLYLTTADYKAYSAMVGSSNLTRAGMLDNEEVNVVIEGSKGEATLRSCLNAFRSMYQVSNLVKPNVRFAEQYRELYETAKQLSADAEPPDAFRELMEEFCGAKTPDQLAEETVHFDKLDVDWVPDSQWECAILALKILTNEAEDLEQYHHINVIRPKFGLLARQLAGRKGGAAQDNVESYANSRMAGNRFENGKVISGGGYFEKGPHGLHRLSPIGLSYVGKRASDKGTQPSI